ncbi:War1p ASCRUDRAFT_5410 [Ascoidea rubescens DSM 1968]|uniref:Zn(2)-C6 fungal-type domain-containing protein n=1 Tax=Ascoidea rubescens DSM 1968 TaxID=1344418 RepID=A0A1D2VPD2_9ASCO|nr:hypothetical protein ASCRUDRAFT_5410 [Ascoidea rubescens DSM 1968]ODV63415.1 hypothetical protein ASCRUDRAFT_5410 [Ascoidea rubescens DSM 1968]
MFLSYKLPSSSSSSSSASVSTSTSSRITNIPSNKDQDHNNSIKINLENNRITKRFTNSQANKVSFSVGSSSRNPFACERCKKLKIKCVPVDKDQPFGDCKKCKELKKHCKIDFSKRKRFQKKFKKFENIIFTDQDKLSSCLNSTTFSASPASFNSSKSPLLSSNTHFETKDAQVFKEKLQVPAETSFQNQLQNQPLNAQLNQLNIVSDIFQKKTITMDFLHETDTLINENSTMALDFQLSGSTSNKIDLYYHRNHEILDEFNGLSNRYKFSENPFILVNDLTIKNDLVSSNIISLDEAIARLDYFKNVNSKNHLSHSNSIISIPQITIKEFREHYPILFLTIMSITSKLILNRRFQKNKKSINLNKPIIEKQFLIQLYHYSHITQEVLSKGRKTLELLKSLLLTVNWFNDSDLYSRVKTHFFLNLLNSMVLDLGLDKDKNVGPKLHLHNCSNYLKTMVILNQVETDECRKILVHAYIYSFSYSMFSQRPNLLSWSNYINQTCQFLQNSSEDLNINLGSLCSIVHLVELCLFKLYPNKNYNDSTSRAKGIHCNVDIDIDIDDYDYYLTRKSELTTSYNNTFLNNISKNKEILMHFLKKIDRISEFNHNQTFEFQNTYYVCLLFLYENCILNPVITIKRSYQLGLKNLARRKKISPFIIKVLENCHGYTTLIIHSFLKLDSTSLMILPLMCFPQLIYAVGFYLKLHLIGVFLPNNIKPKFCKMHNNANLDVKTYCVNIVQRLIRKFSDNIKKFTFPSFLIKFNYILCLLLKHYRISLNNKPEDFNDHLIKNILPDTPKQTNSANDNNNNNNKEANNSRNYKSQKPENFIAKDVIPKQNTNISNNISDQSFVIVDKNVRSAVHAPYQDPNLSIIISGLNQNINQHDSLNSNKKLNVNLNENAIQSANQGVNQTMNQNINANINEDIDQNMNEIIHTNISQSMDQNTNQNINQFINQNMNQNVQSINQIFDQDHQDFHQNQNNQNNEHIDINFNNNFSIDLNTDLNTDLDNNFNVNFDTDFGNNFNNNFNTDFSSNVNQDFRQIFNQNINENISENFNQYNIQNQNQNQNQNHNNYDNYNFISFDELSNYGIFKDYYFGL